MQLTARTPAKSLDRVYALQPATRDQIERFKTSYLKLLPLINEKESEENVKDHLMDFLKEVYYRDAHVVAPKGKTDFVIHLGKDATTQAGVLFEVKRPANKGEMITRQNLNVKAFHELLLYYFQERQRSQNSDIRHCVITNVFEWFIFDAALIDRLFYRNAHLTKEYKAWATGQKVSKNNDLFYNEIVKPFLAELTDEIPFTYFDIRDYQKIIADADKVNDKALLSLYKILSPTHLLKLPTATDSNRLNPKFYSELLHLIGLEEVKEGGKKVIRRKEAGKRDEGSLLENTLIELDSSGKFYQLHDRSQYGATTDEQLFSVALELCITWVNRILFLKLLESQLVKYHGGNKDYTFLNRETIPDFDELNKLFFRVLARKPSERQASIQTKFGRVPYLNSSLFETTELENDSIGVNQLDNGLTLPILRNSVLSDNPAYKNTKEVSTLAYLFAFLDAYDFASESREEIQEKNRTLINASVLGLIFEKINGYKDGSFYTPGFITEYMCRETIRKAVVQKFNDAKGWDCKDFTDLENKDLDRAEANTLINEVRICDPAVGSGHFLVSALNELIAVKSDLGILQDATGKRIKDYTVSILNDELIVQDEDETPFQYVLGATGKPTAERQRVQKTLFHEKQTIIENCLFGVDINPNSVKICRLRLWIELLKNAYYTDESGFTELETLPNIDINIKQGNSLLNKFSLTEDLSDVFKKQKFSLRTYKDAVAAYKDAKSKDAKAELQRFINEIKSQFRETVINRDPRRKKLAKLRGERILLDSELSIFDTVKDPKLIELERKRYDKLIEQVENEISDIENNALYRGSFEWRFEFPEVLNDKGDFVGFDAIIGNPPYFSMSKIKEQADYFASANFETYSKGADIYCLFYELGGRLLKSDGYLTYITSNSWLRAIYGELLKSYFKNNLQPISLLNIEDIQIFEEATVESNIITLQKRELTETFPVANLSTDYRLGTSLEEYFQQHNFIFAVPQTAEWFIGNKKAGQLKSKIEYNSKLLKDFSIRINFGIKTGYNEGFIINEEQKEILINLDVKNSQIIRPILRGRDLKKYVYTFEKMYLINSHNGIKSTSLKRIELEKEYPIVYNYLKDFLPKIEQRSDKGDHWTNLRNCAYLDDFEKPKIIWGEISDKPKFAYDSYNYYAEATTFLMTGEKLKFLLAILNSKVSEWYFNLIGTTTGMGTNRWKKYKIELLPIKIPSEPQEKIIERIVDEIISQKKQSSTADTSALEAEIDQLVYELYGLTEEEIAIVEGQTL